MVTDWVTGSHIQVTQSPLFAPAISQAKHVELISLCNHLRRMDSDFLVNIVKTLATAFVFVATLWAIMLPSIREDRGRGSSILWGVLFTIILALSAVYLMISLGPLTVTELSSGEPESRASDISIISVVMTFVWLITFWAVGFGVLKALSDLSYRRDNFDAIEQREDATKD